jgi:hypothetical protein
MFWNKKKTTTVEAETAKLSGPRNVPGIVQQYLTSQKKMDPEYAPLLKSVVRSNDKGGYDIRIYDESEQLPAVWKSKVLPDLDDNPG